MGSSGNTEIHIYIYIYVYVYRYARFLQACGGFYREFWGYVGVYIYI